MDVAKYMLALQEGLEQKKKLIIFQEVSNYLILLMCDEFLFILC